MHRNPTMRQPAELTPRLIEYLERVTDRVRAWRRCHACGYHGPNSKNLDGTQVSCAACRADLTKPAAPAPVVGVDLGGGNLTDVTVYVRGVDATTYGRRVASAPPPSNARVVPYIMAGTRCDKIGYPALPPALDRVGCRRCRLIVDVNLLIGTPNTWSLVCKCGRSANMSPEWMAYVGDAAVLEFLEKVFA